MEKKSADDKSLPQLLKRLGQLSLEGIQMLDGMCHRSPTIDLRGLPPDATQNIQLGGGLNKAEKHISVKASFRVMVGAHAPADIEVAATFIMRYRFSGAAKISQGEMELFCRRIGGMAAWPYWREFVQGSMTRMGLPPLMVPMLNPIMLEKVPDKVAGPPKGAPTKKKATAHRKSK